MYSYRYRYYHSRSGIFYFNGEDIDEWLNQLESYFIKSQIDEHRKLDVATGHLTGQALEWYHQWNRARLQRWLQIWTWTDFVRDLKFRFWPPAVKSQSEILLSMSKMMEELKQSINEMKAQSSIYMSNLSTLNSQTSPLCDVHDVDESLKVEEEQLNLELFDLTESKEIIEDIVNVSDITENQECSLQVEFNLPLIKSALYLNHESVDMDLMAARTEVISTYSSSKLGSTDKVVDENNDRSEITRLDGSFYPQNDKSKCLPTVCEIDSKVLCSVHENIVGRDVLHQFSCVSDALFKLPWSREFLLLPPTKPQDDFTSSAFSYCKQTHILLSSVQREELLRTTSRDYIKFLFALFFENVAAILMVLDANAHVFLLHTLIKKRLHVIMIPIATTEL